MPSRCLPSRIRPRPSRTITPTPKAAWASGGRVLRVEASWASVVICGLAPDWS
ncbi:hypothetical protein [Streptomyces halstedii]|uniref:hypothetical protein n=1 Tax=Streptomyces halstedii TaxID=1944 RepID=UPI003F4E2341